MLFDVIWQNDEHYKKSQFLTHIFIIVFIYWANDIFPLNFKTKSYRNLLALYIHIMALFNLFNEPFTL